MMKKAAYVCVCVATVIFAAAIAVEAAGAGEEALRKALLRQYLPEADRRLSAMGRKASPETMSQGPGGCTRVLTVDGGGVRGVIAAQQLVALEQAVRDQVGDPNALLVDYFDMVGGSSTGGIMALALLSGRSAAQVSQLWYDDAPFIFDSKMANWLGPAIDAAYENTNLFSTLASEFGSDTLQGYINRRNQSLLVTAFDISRYQDGSFTRSFLKMHGDFLAKDAGASTSAAPTYFPTVVVNPIASSESFTMIDGGLVSNNPTLIALAVADNDRGDLPINSTLVFSVGTGLLDVTVEGVKDWGYTPWFTEGAITDLLLYAPQAAVDGVVRTLFQSFPDNYVRIQYDKRSPTLKLASCDSVDYAMDNVSPENMELLVKCGKELAAANAPHIEQLAKKLVHGV